MDALHALLRNNHEGRRGIRCPVSLAGAIGSSVVGRRVVWLTDISSAGCKISTSARFIPGATLVITIPTLAPIGTTVRWSTAEAVGLSFAQPLHGAVVDRIVKLGTDGTRRRSEGVNELPR
ncbi:MAG TPA: hypothetical protein VM900_05880 [Sphingomonas sp.]|nr:hypothetical protein [Sphingomonas sp.]